MIHQQEDVKMGQVPNGVLQDVIRVTKMYVVLAAVDHHLPLLLSPLISHQADVLYIPLAPLLPLVLDQILILLLHLLLLVQTPILLLLQAHLNHLTRQVLES
jgi:hypothetical protein